MSTPDAKDDVLYFEAELASLREELTYPIAEKRKEFVKLRIARIEKQIPDILEKASKDQVRADWLARINHPKRG